MNTDRPANPRRGYTDDDLRDYAYHLWLQSGMSFAVDCWGEALACLQANLPKCNRRKPRPAPAGGASVAPVRRARSQRIQPARARSPAGQSTRG